MTLKEKIKSLDEPTAREIKLPSGETIKIGDNTPIGQSSQDQLKELNKIPKIDLPPLDEENGND